MGLKNLVNNTYYYYDFYVMYIFALFDLIVNVGFIVFVFKLLLMLLSVALLTAAERKVLAIIQGRESIHWVGLWGIIQPFADALKLVFKEITFSWFFNNFFLFGPILVFIFSILFWVYLPMGESIIDFNYALLSFYAISIGMSFFMFLSGFSSNNLFAFIGSCRYLSMVFSFELLFCLFFLIIVCNSSTLNFYNFIFFQIENSNFFFNCSVFFIVFLIVLAEMNRHPTDLGESEGDLVAGFFTEYSAMGFGLFFMGEYLNMFTMSIFIVCLFLGVNFNSFVFSVLVLLVALLIIAIRGAYPRFRFDAFIYICWLSFLFILLGFFWFTYGVNFFLVNLFVINL